LDAAAFAGDLNFTGGIGADSVGMGTNLTSADTISGGAGADTLSFTDSNAADDDLAHVTGVETVILGDATSVITFPTTYAAPDWAAIGGRITINAAGLTGANSLNFDGSGDSAGGTFYVTGGAGADTISGGAGADSLVGGDGADILFGGGGADTLSGGAGADIFKYNATTDGNASEQITDFSHADGDTLSFSNVAFDPTAADANFISTATYSDTLGVAGQASFIYDTVTHILHYDSNGATAGGDVAIAQLTGDAVVATDIQFH
ncbi:MAG: hypothetical protein Q8S17_09305, partial [Humidesulfovibrio sp.]|nr:hypothetical protein [Humidesulfovibrio sp.]